MGAGINGVVTQFEVYAPSGGQPSLYACGGFSASPSAVLRWSGTSWLTVGQNAPFSLETDAMLAFDSGNGPKLYIGIQGSGSSAVWTWNGTTWAAAGTGLFSGAYVDTFAVYDDGSGPALYAGGSSLTTTDFAGVARFNGTSWSSVPNGPATQVMSLTAHDDGTGPALYAGGAFYISINSQPMTHLVRWNGTAWTSVAGQLAPSTYGWITKLLSVDDDGAGPHPASLYAGGTFSAFGSTSSGNFARLDTCTCYANCDGSTVPPVLNVNDFQCFLNKFAANDPTANCDGSTAPPILNVNDFQCFVNRFAVGCP
jgi:hypothetical protein